MIRSGIMVRFHLVTCADLMVGYAGSLRSYDLFPFPVRRRSMVGVRFGEIAGSPAALRASL
jgi:hypothetical protein